MGRDSALVHSEAASGAALSLPRLAQMAAAVGRSDDACLHSRALGRCVQHPFSHVQLLPPTRCIGSVDWLACSHFLAILFARRCARQTLLCWPRRWQKSSK